MIKQGELTSTQWSTRQIHCPLCPWNEYHDPKPLRSRLHQMCKAVCLYRPISPFVKPSYKLLRASHKSMEHHLEGNGFCFLAEALWLWGNWFANKDMHQKYLAIPSLRNCCFLFSSYPLCTYGNFAKWKTRQDNSKSNKGCSITLHCMTNTF